MELFRLRRRLVLAKRGHKLLQDKLEEMMRRFLALAREVDKAKADFQAEMKKIIAAFLYSRIVCAKKTYTDSLEKIEPQLKFNLSSVKVMNVSVPLFSLQEFRLGKKYDFFQTSAQLDVALAGSNNYLESLLTLSRLFKSLEILSYEIERARRRVNALEYILIPSIQETIRYISQKLSELERANLVRLMRIKELVRR
jgi:V/A-type H+-transporting ATPase subunit D